MALINKYIVLYTYILQRETCYGEKLNSKQIKGMGVEGQVNSFLKSGQNKPH